METSNQEHNDNLSEEYSGTSEHEDNGNGDGNSDNGTPDPNARLEELRKELDKQKGYSEYADALEKMINEINDLIDKYKDKLTEYQEKIDEDILPYAKTKTNMIKTALKEDNAEQINKVIEDKISNINELKEEIIKRENELDQKKSNLAKSRREKDRIESEYNKFKNLYTKIDESIKFIEEKRKKVEQREEEEEQNKYREMYYWISLINQRLNKILELDDPNEKLTQPEDLKTKLIEKWQGLDKSTEEVFQKERAVISAERELVNKRRKLEDAEKNLDKDILDKINRIELEQTSSSE